MSKKISILYNTSWYIYNFRSNLIKKIIDNGYDVLTIAPIDDYTSKLEDLGCTHVPISIDSSSKNPFKDLKTLIQLYQILSKYKPDVQLNYTAKANIYGTLAANYLGIPTINNIAGLGLGFVEETYTTKLLRFLYSISQKKASVVFFQNTTDYNEFTSRGITQSEKSKILPGSGVDLDHYHFSELPKLREGPFTFLLVSRMLYSKGVYLLLETAERLYNNGSKNLRVQLLGDIGVDNDDAIPVQVIESWNKKPFVEYLGRTDDVRPFIKKAHCMILPTYYREGTPRSILEGLAMGRPIITTDAPGCRNTVEHGKNGYLVKPREQASLQEEMEKIMNHDENELQQMGAESRSIAEKKYDEALVINKYLEEIKRVSIS